MTSTINIIVLVTKGEFRGTTEEPGPMGKPGLDVRLSHEAAMV